MPFTKRYQEEVEAFQEKIDNLTLELTAAKMENERLTAECKAWDQGRDEMVENYEGQLADSLEILQIQLDKIKVLEAKINEMQAIIDKHNKNCLQDFKNYTSHNDDVTTT